jgi:hypothetical protein
VKPPRLGIACLGATAAKEDPRIEAIAAAEAGLTRVWRMAAEKSRLKHVFENE